MFYERKVKYLDYLVEQEKCGNAGYVKLEARGDICNICLSVSNLRTDESKSLKVYAVSGEQEREMCTLEVFRGKGAKTLMSQPLSNLGGTGIPYEQLEAIKIPLAAERELFSQILQIEKMEKMEEIQEKESKSITVAQTTQEQLATGEIKESIEIKEMTNVSENKEIQETQLVQIIDGQDNRDVIQENEGEAGIAGKTVKESIEKSIEEPIEESIEESVEESVEESIEESIEEPKETVPLCDTKWKQLWQIYPHIRPFGDEREYISLSPGDFVILSERYFRMVNNSFLLHGYYNYKHLVLKCVEMHGGVRYYIGVPGNYYDREKQVAVMFGFESFDSLSEPAEPGDYGYYMMRVEL